MYSIIVLIVFGIFFNKIYSLDNCNNNYSNNYCERLFNLYNQAELKDQQKGYAKQILSFAAVNSLSLDSSRLEILKNAYAVFGCVIFPGLLEKNKIAYFKSSSPVQFASYKDFKRPIIVQNKDLQVMLEVLDDKDKMLEKNHDLSSLQFTIFKKNKKINAFNKSSKGFLDVEIDTFFKDSVWHAIIYSYNAQVREKTLFSFFQDGTYACHMVPENFNKKKFCVLNQELLFMTCDIKYQDLEGGKYIVNIQASNEQDIKILKNVVIPSTHYNPQHAMNIVAIEQNDPVLVWVYGHLYMQKLTTDQLYDLGQLNFSSVSKISFSNNGRIAWIEGYENGKDLLHGLIQAWNLQKMKHEREWHSAAPFVRNYIFSPNGVFGLGLSSSSKNNNVFLCDASNGSILAQFKTSKQIVDYCFKSNSEILISCGKESWYTIDITALQMANWLAKTKSFEQVIVFLRERRNQLFQEALTSGNASQVFEL